MPQDAEKGNKDSLACLQILFSHLAPVPSMAETSWVLGGRDPRGCSSPNYRMDKGKVKGRSEYVQEVNLEILTFMEPCYEQALGAGLYTN